VILVVDSVGQLANSLFRFAHFVAAADEQGFTVANPRFGYAEHFAALQGDPLCRYPVRQTRLPAGGRRAAAALAAALDGALARFGRLPPPLGALALANGEECRLSEARFTSAVRRARLLCVRGWLFRDEPALSRRAGLVRRLFTPAEPRRRAAAAAVDAARARCEVLVGVHMRRGDYAAWRGGRYFFSPAQYDAIIAAVAASAPAGTGFLVCSDDPPAAAALERDVVRGPGHPVEDLYALAGCDAIVGPPSTFSAWASFYGERPLHHVEDPAAPIPAAALGIG
jgi:hypothetical protein